MAKRENMFALDALKRHEMQESIKSEVGLKPKKPSRKEKMNITLPSEYKDRLVKSAKEKHLSASVLIQMWIDEHC